MARATLAQLITRVRFLINDPIGAGQQFADNDIQDTLDLRRAEMRFVPLRPIPTYLPGATVVFLDYYADTQCWEQDVLLQDTSFNTVTAATAEYLVGHWQFASQPNGIGVRATGKTFDVYGAAADLCGAWVGLLKLRYSFATDTEKFSLKEMIENLMTLKEEYRRQQWPQVNRLVQADAFADKDGGGVVYPSLAPEGW